MNDRILVVFEETNQLKKDQISELVNLSRKECVITTIDELSKNKNIKDFCSVVDCTFDNKIFNRNKEKGTVLKNDNIIYSISFDVLSVFSYFYTSDYQITKDSYIFTFDLIPNSVSNFHSNKVIIKLLVYILK